MLSVKSQAFFGLFLDREARDRDCFGVAHLEYRRQPGDLQDFLKLAAQVAELERSALGFGVQMRLDQCSQLSAVDVLNVIHVKDEFFLAVVDQGLQEKTDRKSTRLNSSHTVISYAVFCLKKKKEKNTRNIIANKT